MKVPVSTLLAEKSNSVYSVSSDVSVQEAVLEMNRYRVGSIIVMDGEKLSGIFTERDVLHRVVAAGLDPLKTPVTQVMTQNVETVAPETSIDEAMELITTKRHRHLPVVEESKLIGLISIGDITRWISQSNENEAQSLWHYITGSYPS
jgi:CBS domain-containing protein